LPIDWSIRMDMHVDRLLDKFQLETQEAYRLSTSLRT